MNIEFEENILLERKFIKRAVYSSNMSELHQKEVDTEFGVFESKKTKKFLLFIQINLWPLINCISLLEKNQQQQQHKMRI